ncbi:hypothetical protein ACQUEU_08965 [Enterococcus casseliflavus]|uniref:hypothetical protein n=1 Tax=Enterococcus casseliflavus TaxID=37734 RepID=UPI003D0D703E
MTTVSRGEITITNVDDGKPSYTHTAYAWSADGTDRFTTTYPNENIFTHRVVVNANVSLPLYPKSTSGDASNARVTITLQEDGGIKLVTATASDPYYRPLTYVSSADIGTPGEEFYLSFRYKVKEGNYLRVRLITWNTGGQDSQFFEGEGTANLKMTLVEAPSLHISFDPVSTQGSTYTVGDEVTLYDIKFAKGIALPYTPAPSEDFVNAYPTYAGTYVDDQPTASTDPTDYTWQRILGPGGKDGDSAPLISLSGATQAITVDKDGKITPASSFAVNGTAVNTAISNWTYSLNGGNFGSALPTGVTRSGNTVTIDPTKAVFDTFTIKAADATVSDVFTISRIKDGGEGPPGSDAYTVFLTNESYTFAGSTTSALAGSTTTEVIVYKGTNKITPTSITVGTMPTGLSSSVSGSIITLTATTALVSKSGTVPITIVADGKTFTKQFSYALSLQGGKGDPGNPGKGVSAEEISYAISQDGTTPPTSGWSGTRPTPKAGWYMWTRTRFKYTDNTYSAYFYLVAQQGKDAIVISDTAPDNPTKGTLWQDSSVVPQIIKVFDGTAWSMWGMPVDNLLATNILSENGVFKRLEGAEIVGSEFINPYTRSYNDGTFAQGTQRIGSAELYNSGVIKNSQGAITQSYETIFSHQFVSMARYSGSATGDQNELIASASLSFDTLTLNDRENGFSGMIHARQLTDTPWMNLPYAAGFRTSENNPCQYQISYNMKGKRTITFRGQVERTSGAMTGTTYPFGIGTVPASIRPTENTFKLAAGDATELQTVRVAMLGTAQPSIGNSIQVKVVGNSQYVDISALTYDIP